MPRGGSERGSAPLPICGDGDSAPLLMQVDDGDGDLQSWLLFWQWQVGRGDKMSQPSLLILHLSPSLSFSW